MARPSKYSKEVETKICTAIANGVPLKYAAMAGGISGETMRRWMIDGEAGLEPYVGFLEAVKEAEEKAVPTLLLVIRNHATKNWTAAAWMLERMHPEEFARQRLELTGANGGPIEHQVAPIQFNVVPPPNADKASEE